ncbi:MAG: hypothetical protein C0404_04095 [Verrucomicrobia bacterium]|nr:hypothetical protein [Verrucomicrobiota bacterium]
MGNMKRLVGLVLGLVFMPMAASAQYLYQEHYRWRNDDGTESTASWKANADTAINGVSRGTNIRLRVSEVNRYASGYTFPVTARLEYSASTNGPWAAVSTVSDGAYPFEMTTTSGYADGDGTTAQLTGTGTFVAGKCVESPNNTSAYSGISLSQYSNFEYCFKATAKAAGGTTYYFRLAGFNYQSYTLYPQLTMAAGEANEAPVIRRSALTATGSVVAAFSYQIRASGSEPITYGASGLPAGVTFDGTNTLKGTPASEGTYSVGLTATNVWGSDTQILALTVLLNQPPAASNQTVSVAQGGEVLIVLPWSDPDQAILTDHAFTIVAGSSHGGVIQSYNQRNGTTLYPNRYYYKADAIFAGQDSFTWKCNDGKDDSNIGTVSVIVNGVVPVPRNQTACVATNTPTTIPASYIGGGGYTSAVFKISGPAHGTVTVTNGASFRYVPTAGYLGADSFTWNMKYGVSSLTGTTVTVTCSIGVKDSAMGGDWPQWRADEYRSAMTVRSLPSTLYQHWRRDFPAYSTPGVLTEYSSDDFGYFQPVMAGTTVVVNVTGRDKLVAMDAVSGALKWTFYTDGPTRYPPVISNGRVYAPSDDGYMYCLDLETGVLISRFAAGPSNRRMFGQDRMISPWMVRGGPMAAGGQVYFASGLWPMEGVFAYALNGATGAEVWRNDWLGGMITGQPHDGQPTVSGPSPQGYLSLNNDNSTLYVPGTEAHSALLNLATGNVISWWQGGTYQLGLDSGGYKLMINGGQYVNLGGYGGPFGSVPVQITAGVKSYTATDAGALGASGTVRAMLAGGNQLFVMTQQGSLYCFGGTQVTPSSYTAPTTPLPTINDAWTTKAAQILAGATAKEGCILVAGIGTERLVDELVKQAPLLATIVVIDPDTNKVAALRATMDAAGYYGSRISAIVGEPLNSGFPQYSARLVVSEDLTAAGYPSTGSGQVAEDFIKNLYRVIMPYGGMAWLPLSSGQQGTFAAQVTAANLDLVTVGRSDPFATLTRTSLKNASNAKAGSAAYDGAVTGLLGVQWFSKANHSGYHGTLLPNTDNYNGVVKESGSRQYFDAFTGLTLSPSAWDGSNGVVSTSSLGSYVNPFTGLPGLERPVPGGYGCGAFRDFGYTVAGRAGTAAFYNRLTGAGTIHIAGVRSSCGGNPGGNVGSGVQYWDAPGCYCGYSMRASFAMAPMPDVENWSRWGYGPVMDVVDERPLRVLGVNFGAPGDHLAPDGKVWLGHPAQIGSCPNVAMNMTGSGITNRYHHSSRIKSEGLKWVASSHVQGMTNFILRLAQPAVVLNAPAAPVIDGVLNDACWNGNAELLVASTGSPGSQDAAHAWLRYDATNLYVAFTGDNLIPQALNYSGEMNTRWHVFLSSREKVIVNGVSLSAHFSISCLTNLYAYLDTSGGVGRETAWTGSWTGSVKGTYGQPFTAEFCIPWSTVEAAGLWKDDLIVNLYGPGSRRLRDLNGDSGYWSPGLPEGVYGDVGRPCRRFVPLFFDTAKGDAGVPVKDCKVKLHFAETEGAAVGQRVFDVKLQGNTVLSNLDIAQASLSAGSGQAGGQNGAVVREFTLPTVVGNSISLDLVPKTGQPMISGLEIAGSYGARTNVAPVAVLIMDTNSGPAPLTVAFNARCSSDDVGISRCEWGFGDGTSAIGSLASHTYTTPGVYTVMLRVTDSDGLARMASTTVTVTGVGSSDFVCTIRASGGDYTNLSSWQTAMVSDLTASNSLLFGVTDLGNYAGSDDGAGVTFTGGGTGRLKHVNRSGVAYVIGCTNTIQPGMVTCASGHWFAIGDAGRQIVRAVAECYHDWPTGLYDRVNMSGWGTSVDRYPKIYVPRSQRHTGRPFAAGSTNIYSGFTLVNNVDAQWAVTLGSSNVRLEGVAIRGLSTGVARIGGINVQPGSGGGKVWISKCLIYRAGAGYGMSTITGYGTPYISNTIIIGDQGGGVNPCYGTMFNVTIVNGLGTGLFLGQAKARNVLCSGNLHDFQFDMYNGGPDVGYCASGDGTLAGNPAWSGNRTNQTFAFACAASNDFHLAGSDTGAMNVGTADTVFDPTLPVADDIDGEYRTDGSPDVGADEAPAPNRPPTITSALTASGTVLQSFSYTITATGTAPITYGASGLPAGLSLAGAVISGTPITAGTNNVTLTAANALGGVTNTLVLAMAANPDANANGMPDAWETANFGSTTNANGGAQDDWDHDGMCNYAEWKAGTNPTNANSRLQVSRLRLEASPGTQGSGEERNLVIEWSSVAGKWYRIQSSTNLLAGFDGVAVSNIPATPTINMSTVIVDQVRLRYYRVTVE